MIIINYENQYNYYYNVPNEKGLYHNEERYYEPLNEVNYIKNKGNNVLISDVYVKPRIEPYQNQFYYNNINNNDYDFQQNYNIYGGNRNNKRPFPLSTHNHVFYVSK